jgi:hypothetical protein
LYREKIACNWEEIKRNKFFSLSAD